MNRESQKAKILRLIKENGSLSVDKLVDLTGIKRTTIRGRLSEYKKLGIVSKKYDDTFELVVKVEEKLI